jgi:hypothetical protein
VPVKLEMILLWLRTAIGVAVAALVWVLWMGFGLLPDGESPATLLSAIIPGLAGGAVCAWLSPPQRFTTSVAAGLFLTVVLLWLMARLGLQRSGEPFLLWYWPIWLTPAFCVGAALVRRGRRFS